MFELIGPGTVFPVSDDMVPVESPPFGSGGSAETPLEDLSGQLSLSGTDVTSVLEADEPPDQEFLIPIHHFVAFTDREVAVIDHPAVQRLFDVHQLGQTNLVFRGATHKRGEHLLGTVETVTMLMDSLTLNARRRNGVGATWQKGAPLTKHERNFTRLAALLHDVGHLAAGHTLEDELGLLPAHDADDRLKFVFERETWAGRALRDTPVGETLEQRIDRLFGDDAADLALRFDGGQVLSASDIVIHIISKDKQKLDPSRYAAATNFRINVLRDLVANTICADLLDYLHRDWHHISKERFFDTRLLQYMELRTDRQESQVVVNLGRPGRDRPDAVTAILDLLESRYQLWEVALLHRTKTGAASMLERAVGELADCLRYFEDDAGLQSKVATALLNTLFEASDSDVYRLLGIDFDHTSLKKLLPKGALLPPVVSDLLWRLKQRVLHKQVAFVGPNDTASGADISARLAPSSANTTQADRLEAAKLRLLSLRELERDFELGAGSLSMYCAPYGLGGKLAKVRVLYRDTVLPLHEMDRRHHEVLTGGHLDAQLARFDRLWRASLFASPECLEKLRANDLEDVLRLEFRVGVLGDTDTAVSMRNVAELLASRAKSPHHGRVLRSEPLVGAREGEAGRFPSGAPTARSYFE